jgi:hypothetical protein
VRKVAAAALRSKHIERANFAPTQATQPSPESTLHNHFPQKTTFRSLDDTPDSHSAYALAFTDMPPRRRSWTADSMTDPDVQLTSSRVTVTLPASDTAGLAQSVAHCPNVDTLDHVAIWNDFAVQEQSSEDDNGSENDSNADTMDTNAVLRAFGDEEDEEWGHGVEYHGTAAGSLATSTDVDEVPNALLHTSFKPKIIEGDALPQKRARKATTNAKAAKSSATKKVNDNGKRKTKKNAKARKDEIRKVDQAYLKQKRLEDESHLDANKKGIQHESSIITRQSNNSSGDTEGHTQSPSPKEKAAMKYQPVSHEPILPGQFGYGTFKSRIVFEADPCPPEQRYGTSPEYDGRRIAFTHRMSATKKFMDWREKGPISRLKDRGLRNNQRLIYLIEHEPFGPRGEAAHWADGFKAMQKRMKILMPDSYIIVKTSVSASHFVGAGHFRQYVDALRYLVEANPHHFRVELEDESIMSCNIPRFFPDNTNEFSLEKQVQKYSADQICVLRGYDKGMAQLRTLAEKEEEKRRDEIRASTGRRANIDYNYIESFIHDKYEVLKKEVLESRLAQHADRCNSIVLEFVHVRKFIEDLRYFYDHHTLPDQKPLGFQSMKPKKKPKTKSITQAYNGEDSLKEEQIDPDAEATKIVAALPWIDKERALEHMHRVIQANMQHPAADYPPLEVPVQPTVQVNNAADLSSNDATNVLDPQISLVEPTVVATKKRKREDGDDTADSLRRAAKKVRTIL